MDDELNEKIRLKKFRDEAKNICHKNNNVNNISLMATYAEKVYFLDLFEIRFQLKSFFVSKIKLMR